MYLNALITGLEEEKAEVSLAYDLSIVHQRIKRVFKRGLDNCQQ